MWSLNLNQKGMIEFQRSLLVSAVADGLDPVTLLVGEAFGNSMIRNDGMESVDDFSNMSASNSFSESVKSPGGRQFLALSKVIVNMTGSFNAILAIRAILRMTAIPEHLHFVPHLEQIWRFVQMLQTHYPAEISPQGGGELHPEMSNESANVLETFGGIELQRRCELSLEEFIVTLRSHWCRAAREGRLQTRLGRLDNYWRRPRGL